MEEKRRPVVSHQWWDTQRVLPYGWYVLQYGYYYHHYYIRGEIRGGGGGGGIQKREETNQPRQQVQYSLWQIQGCIRHKAHSRLKRYSSLDCFTHMTTKKINLKKSIMTATAAHELTPQLQQVMNSLAYRLSEVYNAWRVNSVSNWSSLCGTDCFILWPLLYSAILRSPADLLRSHATLHEWLAIL